MARKRTKQICGSTCGKKFEKILDDDMKFDAKKHLKAHRIKKERAKMALFEFVMEAMRQQIGWRRKEQIWMVVQWPCKMLPLFTAKWKNWRDSEELKPKPKAKCIFVIKKKEKGEHQDEWCRTADV